MATTALPDKLKINTRLTCCGVTATIAGMRSRRRGVPTAHVGERYHVVMVDAHEVGGWKMPQNYQLLTRDEIAAQGWRIEGGAS